MEREYLTKEQAIEFVGGQRDLIHSFIGGSAILLGCDHKWSEFEDMLDNAEVIEKAGEQATAMKHPLAVLFDGRWRFFEKKENTIQFTDERQNEDETV